MRLVYFAVPLCNSIYFSTKYFYYTAAKNQSVAAVLHIAAVMQIYIHYYYY